MHPNIHGTGVALITPFKLDHSIDFEALTSLIEHNLSGGVNFLVVMGTTGESATLSFSEKQAVLAHVMEVNKGRVPVVLGVGGNNTQHVIDQCLAFHLEGIEAILSVSPYYNKPTQEGIYQHYKAISENSPIPIILYNVPGRTATNMSADTILRLATDFNNIIGVKEASGDLHQIMEIIDRKPSDFVVLSGDDDLAVPIILMGGQGVISVLGQALSKEYSSMVKFALMKDLVNSTQLHYDLRHFILPLFKEGNPAGIKKLLNILSICQDNVRLPLVKASKNIELEFKEKLDLLRN